MKRALVLAAVLACGPAETAPVVRTVPVTPNAPLSLADRAPADTKLVFRIGDIESVLGQLVGGEAFAPVEQSCKVATKDIHVVEGFVTASFGLRVELHTSMSLDALRCVATQLGIPAVDDGGTMRIGGFLVTTEKDRVVVTSDPPPDTKGGAALSKSFGARVAASSPNDWVAVADLSGPSPTELVLHVAHPRLELAMKVGVDRASQVANVVGPLLRQRGLDKLSLRADGEWVRVESPADSQLALTLRERVLEAFLVPSGSMIPTLLVGDHVYVLKDAAVRPIERGDVVAFKQDGKSFLKRVVGLPGDRVKIAANGTLSIDGNPVPSSAPTPYVAPRYRDEPLLRGHVHEETIGKAHARIFLTDQGGFSPATDVVVPKASVYLLGDNRDNSHDSRAFGPVPMTDVIGRAVVVWEPALEGPESWKRVLSPVD